MTCPAVSSESTLQKAMASMLTHIETTHPGREPSVRCGLGDAVAICDLVRQEIEASHPGRTKGSVSRQGQIAAAAVQRCADTIWAHRERVRVTG